MTGTGAGSRPPRVVYWNNQPAPYVVNRFNAIMRRGTMDFEAWFDVEREPDRDWSVDPSDWLFPARYIPLRRRGRWDLRVPLEELRSRRPDLLVQQSPRDLSTVLGALVGRAAAGRVAFRTLPTFPAWTDKTPWGELSKHFAYRSVDGAKVPGGDGTRYARSYGLPVDRTWRVTQSIDVDLYRSASTYSASDRERRRRALGLYGTVFIYVGRLWKGKGVHHLIDAYRALRESNSNSTLLLLGSGVDEAELRRMAADVPGVVFGGFVQPRELPSWYALANALVFPTLGDPNGLVVEEAMAAGLPVIATTSAGDIRDRISDGRTGYLVPPADPSSLANRMQRIADDPRLRASISQQAAAHAARYTDSRFAQDFEDFVFEILDMPHRHSVCSFVAHLAGRSALLLVPPGEAVAAVGDRAPDPATLAAPPVKHSWRGREAMQPTNS
jgi:glycosyltransferase involved in cell wall biosynthesis